VPQCKTVDGDLRVGRAVAEGSVHLAMGMIEEVMGGGEGGGAVGKIGARVSESKKFEGFSGGAARGESRVERWDDASINGVNDGVHLRRKVNRGVRGSKGIRRSGGASGGV